MTELKLTLDCAQDKLDLLNRIKNKNKDKENSAKVIKEEVKEHIVLILIFAQLFIMEVVQ